MAAHVQVDTSLHTREKILASAARLFASRGYENTALSQVARDARVSKALVLWHFESKEKLFRAALGRTVEPYVINVDDIAGLDERTQIERLIDLFYEFVQEHVYSVRFLFSLILRGENQPNDVLARISDLYRMFRSLLADIIEKGCRSGRFRSDVRPALDASLILGMLDGILIEHFMNGESPHDSSTLLAYLKRTALDRLIA